MPGQRAADDADIRRLRRQCHDAAPVSYSSRILTPQRQPFRGEPPSRARLFAHSVILTSDLVPLDRVDAVNVGRLLAASGTSDVVDAHVVVCSRRSRQRVVTSDPDDLALLDRTLELIVV